MGAVVGGVVANWLIPDFGWASVFYAGGVTPLLLLPALAYLLPESARFLIVRGDTASASKATARMGIRPDRADPAEVESESTRLPVTDLFRHGYGPGTLLLWAAMFLTLVMTYFLVTWLPTVAALAGAHSGLLAVSTLNLGGIVGCLLIGRLADRRTPAIVLGAAYTLGAIAIALIGWAAKDNVMLLIVTGVAGLLGVGAQLVTVSLVATYYDTARRASGVGWSMGWGRLGGIVGPMLGGALIAAGLATSTIFLLAGGVCLCTALVVFAFGMLKQRSVSTQTVREAPA
jgi:AAHS family 4-hydroxybenzoate transporter-like MFS transporter